MEQNGFKVSLPQLVSTLSDAVDLICPVLNNHHKQVAYISYQIAKALNFSSERLADLLTAALLHDVGALSLNARLELLAFEERNPYAHTISGYVLLKDLDIFKKAAEIIKHHHLPWANGAGRTYNADPVHPESHILYLADRVSVSINTKTEVLNQAGDILNRIKRQAHARFHPQYIEVLETLAQAEAFWLNLVSPDIDKRLEMIWQNCSRQLDLEELLEVTKIFARIIDFRSRFTSVHSSGVSAVAGAMAQSMNWPEDDCKKIIIAGNLHDLGKLTIPNEILEKPGQLTKEEYNIMKTHTYHGYYLLDKIEGLEEINEYGSFHHERVDGNGYPFRIKGSDLNEGARIMAVADVFTAITEDRPYRQGMDGVKALQIIQRMAQDSKLDEHLVVLLKENFSRVNALREEAQEQADREYRDFERRIHRTIEQYR